MSDMYVPEPGIYTPEQAPMSVYHNEWDCVGRSLLKNLDEGVPADAIRSRTNKVTPTANMQWGTAFGLLLFEPHEFDAQVVRKPIMSGTNAEEEFRGKGARERAEEWKAQHAGKVWVNGSDWDELHAAAEVVRRTPAARRLLEQEMEIEHSLVWDDKTTGLRCKARPDVLFPAVGCSGDLKTTSGGLSDRDLSKYVVNYYADLQAAMVMRGLIAHGRPFKAHHLIVLSRGTVPLCRVVTMPLDSRQDPSWLERGEAMFDAFLAEWSNCTRTGHFPDWGDRGSTLPVPGYAASHMTKYFKRQSRALESKPEEAA